MDGGRLVRAFVARGATWGGQVPPLDSVFDWGGWWIADEWRTAGDRGAPRDPDAALWGGDERRIEVLYRRLREPDEYYHGCPIWFAGQVPDRLGEVPYHQPAEPGGARGYCVVTGRDGNRRKG